MAREREGCVQYSTELGIVFFFWKYQEGHEDTEFELRHKHMRENNKVRYSLATCFKVPHFLFNFSISPGPVEEHIRERSNLNSRMQHA